MRDDVYERIVYIINNTKGSNVFPDRECFKVIKNAFPHISDYTIGSIYSVEYMRRMKQNHFRLSKIAGDLHDRFNAAASEGQSEGILLRMSDEIDLSPALLARLIVQHRYKDELEEIDNVSTTKTPDSNSAQGPAIEPRKVPIDIEPVRKLTTSPPFNEVKNNPPSKSQKEAVLPVSQTLPVIDSLAEKMQNGTLNETEENTNNPALDLLEKAVSNDTATINDSLVEQTEEVTFSETTVGIVNKPELNFKEKTAVIAKTSDLGADLLEETVSTISKDPNVNDSLTVKIEKTTCSETKVGIPNEAELDSVNEATKVKTTNVPPSNLPEDATSSAEIKSTSEDCDKEEYIEDDPPPKLTITKLMKDPQLIKDSHLAAETSLSILQDDQYGPIADCLKHSLGQEYEMQLVRLARAAGLNFNNEVCLRTTGFDKTPDVKLETPVLVDGFVINWIESKALFGDEETHLGYYREQYQCYYNRFGPGLVIYWFGFQEKITRRYQSQMMIVEDFPKRFEFPDMSLKNYRVNPEFFKRFY